MLLPVKYTINIIYCITEYNLLNLPLFCQFNIKKLNKMKKSILFAFIMIFMLSASTLAASGTKNPANLSKTENKLSEEELSRLTRRVEEIRDIDKTDLTAKEKKEMRKELKGIKENVRRDGGVVYLSVGTLLIIILLVILLV